jgi:hypothetical protein
MKAIWTPMRWPAAWADPSTLGFLKGSGIDFLLVEYSDEFEGIRAVAQQSGLKVAQPSEPPEGVRIVKGEWPGVRISRGNGAASAGPTGVPWVDSNGWAAQLCVARHPDCRPWIDAPPPKVTFPSSYRIAVYDAGSFGARWIVTLDDELAVAIRSGNANAEATWKGIGEATSFFAAHNEWDDYREAALVGVISDYAGENEFFSQELLNLLARAGAHTRVLLKDQLTAASMRGLRAVVYADAKAPSAALRKEILGFVEGGGMLLTTPIWGAATGSRDEHPRFMVAPSGKGRIARSVEAPDDPYQYANDAVIVISHRYDLVRFWNAGAAGSNYLVSPDGKRAVVHLLFYANRGPNEASVRVAGPFRKVGNPGVTAIPQKDAVELHLPQVGQHVALELTV